MRKVLCAGTFDVLHKGHEFFLREAKKHGNSLMVIVALDESVVRFKGKAPLYNQDARKAAVEKLGIADEVILGHKGDIFDILDELRPDVICLGYDQRVDERKLKERLQSHGLQSRIVRLPSFEPHIYKSSKFKPTH